MSKIFLALVTLLRIFHSRLHFHKFTEGTVIRGVEGPKVLAPPPTAHTNISFPLLWAAVHTLGEYKFFYPGFF